MNCPQCNADAPDDQRFCTSCGAPLVAGAAEPDEAAPPPMPAARVGGKTIVAALLPWIIAFCVGAVLSMYDAYIALSGIALPSIVLNVLLLSSVISTIGNRSAARVWAGPQLGAWMVFVVLRLILMLVVQVEDPTQAVVVGLALPMLPSMAISVLFAVVMKRAAALPAPPPGEE